MRADKTLAPAGWAAGAGRAGGAGAGTGGREAAGGGRSFRRVLGVLARAAALVGVYTSGQLALRYLLPGSPGSGPDPDIGGALTVLVAVALTAAAGALLQARRQGFGPAVSAWGPAIAVLTLVGIAGVVRGWLADRASGAEMGGAMELLAPMVALAVVGAGMVAVACLGAAAGDTLLHRARAHPQP